MVCCLLAHRSTRSPSEWTARTAQWRSAVARPEVDTPIHDGVRAVRSPYRPTVSATIGRRCQAVAPTRALRQQLSGEPRTRWRQRPDILNHQSPAVADRMKDSGATRRQLGDWLTKTGQDHVVRPYYTAHSARCVQVPCAQRCSVTRTAYCTTHQVHRRFMAPPGHRR
jgi:hypothetical protein